MRVEGRGFDERGNWTVAELAQRNGGGGRSSGERGESSGGGEAGAARPLHASDCMQGRAPGVSQSGANHRPREGLLRPLGSALPVCCRATFESQMPHTDNSLCSCLDFNGRNIDCRLKQPLQTQSPCLRDPTAMRGRTAPCAAGRRPPAPPHRTRLECDRPRRRRARAGAAPGDGGYDLGMNEVPRVGV
jgi:hypothetical protein